MYLEEKTFRRNIKVVAKGPYIYAFGIVDCRFISESGHIIVLWDQSYNFPALPKDSCIIFSQVVFTPEGYKSIFIYHCHEENDRFLGINLKEYKQGWKKAKPV